MAHKKHKSENQDWRSRWKKKLEEGPIYLHGYTEKDEEKEPVKGQDYFAIIGLSEAFMKSRLKANKSKSKKKR